MVSFRTYQNDSNRNTPYNQSQSYGNPSASRGQSYRNSNPSYSQSYGNSSHNQSYGNSNSSYNQSHGSYGEDSYKKPYNSQYRGSSTRGRSSGNGQDFYRGASQGQSRNRPGLQSTNNHIPVEKNSYQEHPACSSRTDVCIQWFRIKILF